MATYCALYVSNHSTYYCILGRKSIIQTVIFLTSRHYEVETGECSPKQHDNWWIVDPDDNEKINYLQIKRWGPEADRIDRHIRKDTLW